MSAEAPFDQVSSVIPPCESTEPKNALVGPHVDEAKAASR